MANFLRPKMAIFLHFPLRKWIPQRAAQWKCLCFVYGIFSEIFLVVRFFCVFSETRFSYSFLGETLLVASRRSDWTWTIRWKQWTLDNDCNSSNDGMIDIDRHPDVNVHPELKIFRQIGNFFFSNISYYWGSVYNRKPKNDPFLL